MRRMPGRISSERRIELLIVLLVLVAAGFFVHTNGANGASRLALSAAIVEEGTVRLDAYEHTLGVDLASKDGHVYSDKAPGQPLAAVPFWAVYRAVGGDPGTDLRVDWHLGSWWITFWFCALPGALLAALMYRYARSAVPPKAAVTAAVGLFFGSTLYPMSALLFGHILTSLLLMIAFLRLRAARLGGDRRDLLVAGLAAGSAVAVEYTVLIVVVVLAAAAAATHRSSASWFAIGGVPAIVLLGGYHTAAFGGPLQHPYKFSAFDVHHDTLAGIGAPDPALLLEVLLGERGLLSLTPVIAIGIAGLVGGRRRLDPYDVAVPLAVLCLYLLFAAGWVDATGGWSPGPRHLLPAMPLLAVGVALAWQRWRRLAMVATTYSVVMMALAMVTEPLTPDAFWALDFWIHLLRNLDLADTVFRPVAGRGGTLIVFALTALVAHRLHRATAEAEVDASTTLPDELVRHPETVSGRPPSRA